MGEVINVLAEPVIAANSLSGLQCHTAPYTWKVVFECDCQLYEIVMTACTSREETEWRSRLVYVPAKDVAEQTQVKTFNFLSLNIRTLGTVFGKQGKSNDAML